MLSGKDFKQLKTGTKSRIIDQLDKHTKNYLNVRFLSFFLKINCKGDWILNTAPHHK